MLLFLFVLYQKGAVAFFGWVKRIQYGGVGNPVPSLFSSSLSLEYSPYNRDSSFSVTVLEQLDQYF